MHTKGNDASLLDAIHKYDISSRSQERYGKHFGENQSHLFGEPDRLLQVNKIQR